MPPVQSETVVMLAGLRADNSLLKHNLIETHGQDSDRGLRVPGPASRASARPVSSETGRHPRPPQAGKVPARGKGGELPNGFGTEYGPLPELRSRI